MSTLSATASRYLISTSLASRWHTDVVTKFLILSFRSLPLHSVHKFATHGPLPGFELVSDGYNILYVFLTRCSLNLYLIKQRGR